MLGGLQVLKVELILQTWFIVDEGVQVTRRCRQIKSHIQVAKQLDLLLGLCMVIRVLLLERLGQQYVHRGLCSLQIGAFCILSANHLLSLGLILRKF